MSAADIYNDLNSVDLGEKVTQLEALQKQNEKRIEQYEIDIQKLCVELTRMKKTECNLKTNISELYKSSKIEIERKDRQIAELQTRIDDLIFRRHRAGYGNGIKRPTYENHDEQPPKVLKTENVPDVKHEQGTKRCSQSPNHSTQRPWSERVDDYKTKQLSKSRSKSRSESDFKMRRHCRSRSPKRHTTADDDFKAHHYRRRSHTRQVVQSDADNLQIHIDCRSKTPRQRSRSRPEPKAIDNFKARRHSSRSRSKSPSNRYVYESTRSLSGILRKRKNYLRKQQRRRHFRSEENIDTNNKETTRPQIKQSVDEGSCNHLEKNVKDDSAYIFIHTRSNTKRNSSIAVNTTTTESLDKLQNGDVPLNSNKVTNENNSLEEKTTQNILNEVELNNVNSQTPDCKSTENGLLDTPVVVRDNVNNEIKANISVHRRRRCVIQLN